jgi:hypothetical protein
LARLRRSTWRTKNCITAGRRTGGFRSRRAYRGVELRRGGARLLLQRWLRRDFELADAAGRTGARAVAAQVRSVRNRVGEPGVVALLQRLATIVPDPPLIVDLTPDPGDDYLVVLARASGAQTLVC